ncbi:MAG: tRNA dihydrouridine synthase DusB [Actinobacteria bacterium]|nr:tRNA dihydrouridine synthase DusB [Actinomycetota bacterium]
MVSGSSARLLMFADLLAGEPVIELAPMAGITNRAFRRVCREASRDIRLAAGQTDQDGTIYVAEMTTSIALLMGNQETLDLITFDSDESPRSIQLYGVDPDIVGRAVAMVVDQDLADHIDLNFGCPVPKVTRKGGGSALPWKRDLFTDIVQAAVKYARGKVPVTVKMRVGIDDEHETFLDAGRIAAEAGVFWVALHGRTAAQYYGGTANWQAIAQLVEHLPNTPVLGNGDIWSAADAENMLNQTGARGVVVGRGCLGRPWLFGQIRSAFAQLPVPPEPTAEVIVGLLRRHAELLVAMHGDEFYGCREMRKHMAWYLKGLIVGSEVRGALALIESLSELDDLLATIDGNQQLGTEIAHSPRGRTTPNRRVALPDGWLNSQHLSVLDQAQVRAAELNVSGG